MSDKPCTCHPDDNPPVPCPQKFALSECRAAAREARDQAIAIARELARLACCMDAVPRGSIGEQVAKLEALEERIARQAEFDNATRTA